MHILTAIFKKILPFFALITHIHAQCPKIIWSDEFDGTTLNQTKWSHQLGDGCDIGMNNCGWGNNELQWYQTDNTEVSNGTLKIIAKRQTVQTRNYTSSRIRTINKGDIKFGRIEARMKMPIGQGIWPAFWMMPTDNVYGGWPQSGEIDVMEYLGHERATTHGTLHFGNPWPNNANATKSFTLTEGGFNDGFHTFALEWSDNDIKWFVDGYLYSTKTRSDLGSARWPFDQKFHFILNLAVGGNWPGNPNGSTVFPQTFEVDYIRVYDLLNAPYLQGSQKVEFMAKNSVYSIANFPTSSTVVWTVPAGATIVSGAGTKDLMVNWGSVGGKITATVTSPCGETKHELVVKVEAGLTPSVVLENFDTEARIIRTFSSGIYTDNFATPSPNVVNKSALCGKYVRDAGSQYDVFFYDVADIKNGADFTSAEKKFYIDINTNAPVGTTIMLQLENKTDALPANYPKGRHSRYTVVTTKQNEWERLTFTLLDKPDGATSNSAINQMVFLFAPNTNTGATYYFDNLDIYAKTVSSTKDINDINSITLSPNPADYILTLTANINKVIEQIEIMDISGKVVLSQKNINKETSQINIASLKTEMYYISVVFKDGTRVSKAFVKK
jgi:beta-glucanase (GH16 family)